MSVIFGPGVPIAGRIFVILPRARIRVVESTTNVTECFSLPSMTREAFETDVTIPVADSVLVACVAGASLAAVRLTLAANIVASIAKMLPVIPFSI
jgi:hypothetical protein